MIARLIIDPMSVLTQLSSIPWWGTVWSTEPTKDIYRCDSLGERVTVISSGNNGVYFILHVQKYKKWSKRRIWPSFAKLLITHLLHYLG